MPTRQMVTEKTDTTKVEREFTFTIAKSMEDVETITKKESELTEEELKLIVGGTIKKYNEMPDKARNMFIFYLTEAINETINKIERTNADNTDNTGTPV